MFRRVGGFVYLMSVLVGMEGSLAVPSPSTWASADRRAIFSLLHQTFATFATAMRYEPANAKFFYQEIAQASLAQALKMLGCFSSESGLRHLVKPPEQEMLDRLHAVFVMELPHCSYVTSSLPPVLAQARFLTNPATSSSARSACRFMSWPRSAASAASWRRAARRWRGQRRRPAESGAGAAASFGVASAGANRTCVHV